MAAMMALFFLVVCAVGMLRPVKNALALDGLGRTDFYKVYLVSAFVVLFVPLVNRLSDRFPWRWLIPGIALFFSLNLLLLRLLYVDGSTVFGLVFYGWYDLFAAALVTQFFVATQLFFDARMARKAYPVVIAGGSIGATLGGGITGFFAEALGTPNLLIVAALLIAVFAIGMPLVWRVEGGLPAPARRRRQQLRAAEFRDLLANPQVRLIAGMVLMTILVKQLVDYQFNTLTKEVFESRDAISAFQGKFNAATQWLPMVVLAALQPALRRYGVGVAVLLLPVSMVATTAGLVVVFGLAAAVAAKGAETGLRYSAERLGREILYVPVPEEIKLKAKTYIDVAVEKGAGKVASALLIFGLLTVMDYRSIAYVSFALAVLWLAMALQVRREYVRTLARSIEGRFASLSGVFASLTDANTAPVLARALQSDDLQQVAFALDLIDKAAPANPGALAPELNRLLAHPSSAIRRRALDVLGRFAEDADEAAVRALLYDRDAGIREAAVRTLARRAGGDVAVLEALLVADDPAVRTATLSCLVRGDVDGAGLAVARRVHEGGVPQHAGPAGEDERVERALAVALRRGEPDAPLALRPLLDDASPRVASTALRTAALLGDDALYPHMIAALRRPATREAARDGLAAQGTRALPALTAHLLDGRTDATVRRMIPSVLARIPAPETVDALIRCALAPETDQLLDHRSIKALSKLRARNADLAFPPDRAHALLEHELAAAGRYAAARACLAGPGADDGPAVHLLETALAEAWHERREGAFRVLGLMASPDDVHRCYDAIVRGGRVLRANALEWLEATLGHARFRALAPVLGEAARAHADVRAALVPLCDDEDAWVAQCARRAATELGLRPADAPPTGGDGAMDLIDTVFLLQKVDVLRDARSAHLALLASIAEEIDAGPGTVLAREGEPADALHVIVRGAVDLRGAGGELVLTDGMAFGAWGLIDGSPSLFEAKVARPTRLLRIDREEFYDLMSDHPELAFGLLQGLARRMRALVA
jgi:AAA family ATP:ADP antiporter